MSIVSGKEDPQKRIDDLIEYGKALLPYQNNDDCFARKRRWDAQCQDTLQRLFGSGNVILKSFTDTLYYNNKEVAIKSGISILEGAKEQLDMLRESDKLGKIRDEIRQERAEAERRAAVVETKQLGSVIEVIDMLRLELKRRGSIDQQISSIHKALEDIAHQQSTKNTQASIEAPLAVIGKEERKQPTSVYTTEKVVDGIHYIMSKKDEVLVELTCPSCTEEGKRWFGSWQIYGDKKEKVFLKCMKCGYDLEITLLDRTEM